MVMGGKWKLTIGCLLVVLIGVAIWAYVNRDEAVYSRIMNRQGYEVSLIKENVSTSFVLKPDWVPETIGEVNELNLVIEKKFNSAIVLESVGRRENDVYINLNAIPSAARKSGHLLSTTVFNSNGTYSTAAGAPEGKWQLSNESEKTISLSQYGTGDGPDNLSYIFIKDEDENLFDQDLNILFTGYNLYGYKYTGGLVAEGRILLYMAVAIALLFAYRRREKPENLLGLKLVGYTILGAATLTTNSWRVPFGFVVYWLFFRNPKSKPNFKLKQFAALMGLLLFISPVIWPALQGSVGFQGNSAAVSDIPIEELGMDGVWKALAAETYVDEEAKVSEYEAIVTRDGQVKQILFELVQRTKEGYVHTDAIYDAAKGRITLDRFMTETWIQYDRQMEARHFFRRVDELTLLQLKPGIETVLVKLELMDQEPVSYGIAGAETYVVDEAGVHPVQVTTEQPVRGIWLSAWGEGDLGPATRGWSERTDYLFDVFPRSLVE